jgi:hypothetical protein
MSPAVVAHASDAPPVAEVADAQPAPPAPAATHVVADVRGKGLLQAFRSRPAVEARRSAGAVMLPLHRASGAAEACDGCPFLCPAMAARKGAGSWRCSVAVM